MNTEIKPENAIIELVAHDLKGVIEKINRLNELLRDKLQNNSDKEIQQLLSYIDILCEQGKQITTDLLDISEPDSYDKICTGFYPLNQLIEQQAKIYKLQADKKQITFQAIIPNEQFFCEINYSRFIRVLDNLFSNALKFTERGGQIKITLSNIDGKIIIAIHDTGIGIPDELKKEIFKKYTKARRYGTQNEDYTGLGLYIVKKIMDSHKGKIWFDSEENNGTVFYIELDCRIKE